MCFDGHMESTISEANSHDLILIVRL